MHRNPWTVYTKQQRIAELARQSPEMGFTSLAYFIDIDWLHRAYYKTRKDGAAGRGRTNGRGLRSRTWRAISSRCWTEPSPARTKPLRCDERTFPRPARLPRPDRWGYRPLKTKCFSGRWSWCWKPLYEQDFLDCSYGFRPGRSAHQALDALWRQTMAMRGGWILDVDIRKFFDTIDHGHLRDFLKRRVRDGVLLRLIGKWLQCGGPGGRMPHASRRRAARKAV